MRNQKWMRLAAMAAAGMVFVTGCGSSAGTSASTTAVQTESSTEAESAESENTEANSEEADENTETADNEDALVLADQGMVFSRRNYGNLRRNL